MPDTTRIHKLVAKYKESTRQVLKWLLTTYLKITHDTMFQSDETQRITVREWLEMADTIAHANSPIKVPFNITVQLQTSIHLRREASQFYEPRNRDPVQYSAEVTNFSNHNHFIAALEEIQDMIGALQQSAPTSDPSPTAAADTLDAMFNQYLALSLDTVDGVDGAESDDADNATNSKPSTQSNARKRNKKKTCKKKTTSTSQAAPLQTAGQAKRCIHPESERLTNDVVAFRDHLCPLWVQVVLKGVSCAVAGAVCEMLMARINRISQDISSQFHCRNSYKALITTMPSLECAAGIDMDELTLANTYNTLCTFLQDMRRLGATNHGIKLQTRLSAFRLDVDLATLTRQQLKRWTSDYLTIWLYHAVDFNLRAYGNGVDFQNPGLDDKEHAAHVREMQTQQQDVPILVPTRLFSLQRVISTIQLLSLEPAQADVTCKITPGLVFYLQAAVDSFQVMRGLGFTSKAGHFSTTPAPTTYTPTCNVHAFLHGLNGVNSCIFLMAQLKKKLLGNSRLLHDLQVHPSAAKTNSIALSLFSIIHRWTMGKLPLNRRHLYDYTSHDDWFQSICSEPSKKNCANHSSNVDCGTLPMLDGATIHSLGMDSNCDSTVFWQTSPFACGVALLEGLDWQCRITHMMHYSGLDTVVKAIRPDLTIPSNVNTMPNNPRQTGFTAEPPVNPLNQQTWDSKMSSYMTSTPIDIPASQFFRKMCVGKTNLLPQLPQLCKLRDAYWQMDIFESGDVDAAIQECIRIATHDVTGPMAVNFLDFV